MVPLFQTSDAVCRGGVSNEHDGFLGFLNFKFNIGSHSESGTSAAYLAL